VNHTIRIHASGRDLYRTSGAVTLEDTGAPIPDAARALISAGASPSDTMSIASQDATFSPMPLGKLAATHKAPRKSDLAAQARF
jgi:hypothetical protein